MYVHISKRWWINKSIRTWKCTQGVYVIRLLKLKCNTYTFYIKGKRNRDIKRRKKRHEESERARERERKDSMLCWCFCGATFAYSWKIVDRGEQQFFILKDIFLPSFSGFHACCECKKTYRSRMALNRHVREECGRVLYTCPFCHSIMPMKFNLLNHLKKEHGCVPKIWTNPPK